MPKPTLRQQISRILVKWSMPTRQVAINEILRLFPDREEIVKRLEEIKPEECRECSGGILAREEAIKIVKGE